MGRDEAVQSAIEATHDVVAFADELDAAIVAAFHRALRERGYAVVPLEPSDKMMVAAYEEIASLPGVDYESLGSGEVKEIYRAMMEAAR
jgi:50S ribosomal subunit-associated GTPase HflX